MKFTLPNDQGFKQPNAGSSVGSILGSYNIDLLDSRNVIQNSSTALKLLNTSDNASFDGYAAALFPYKSKWYAVSDKLFVSTSPTGTWNAVASSPSFGNTTTDAVIFDNLILIVDGDDIVTYNGSSWDTSWWQTTRGKSALTTGQRFIMKVGADGNLYIVDGGNKVYRVKSNGSGTGTITTTGAGTLDFSARPYTIGCAAVTSSRIFFGAAVEGGGSVIIEWDMGPQSISPNKIHPVGSDAVRCMPVWEDTPIAVLADGNVKYFNGSSFQSFKQTNVQFPCANTSDVIDDNMIHPNGWAIIDSLPHLLVKGSVDNGGTSYAETEAALWNMPSGVWCLDPNIGLYHRFALGSGLSTQDDYGQPALKEVGALMSVKNSNTKFLASYEYWTTASTFTSVLAYQDISRSKLARSWLVTVPSQSISNTWKLVELLHQKLNSGDSIELFYRLDEKTSEVLSGTWLDTNTFNTTDTTTVVKGDVALIKIGPGAGTWMRVSEVNTTASVHGITFEEANSYVAAEDEGTIEVFNFRRLGSISGTGRYSDTFNIPTTDKSHRFQLLIEVRSAASSKNQINLVIIES